MLGWPDPPRLVRNAVLCRLCAGNSAMPEAPPMPRSIIPAQSTLTVPGEFSPVAAPHARILMAVPSALEGGGVVKQQAGAGGESGVLVDGGSMLYPRIRDEPG